jgi:CheY-like chemotaxis protein/signal transduction histidine kinase
MRRTLYFILISIILFIGINTVFYFTIFRQQLDFQTDLLTRQTRLCGNTIEQEGQWFENELNSIPYQDDFTRLFTDEEIKHRGSTNLQKLYTGYSLLINNITVYDNQKNVYSLILDAKNNFVSDYYESQRQIPLNVRDELIQEGDQYKLSIPGFDENGVVRSNILVDLNFTRFVDEIFKRYGLEHTLWQCLVSEDGELISCADYKISMPERDLKRIGSDIREETEGSFIHSIAVDSISTQVVSVYYPVRLVKRNLGIVFSIKTDLFLRSIVIKIILITLISLLLLGLILYLHHNVIKVRLKQLRSGESSLDSMMKTMEVLPFGLLFINPDGSIRMMNESAKNLLPFEDDNSRKLYGDLGLEESTNPVHDTVLQRVFGPGIKVLSRTKSGLKHLHKMEWSSEIENVDTKIVLLIDISEFESIRILDKTSLIARRDLLDSMSREISVPLNQLRETIKTVKTGHAETLHKSCSLLSNLINATMDFASQEAGKAVVEEIPFYLRSEIDLALEPFRSNEKQVSIITKIRNDVPEKLVGDPFRFRQALSHLMENAMELTTDGRILISSELLEHHPGNLKLQFQVEDTGTGLPAEVIEEIMNESDPEKRMVSEDPDEFRLRLDIARQHIKLLRGSLWVDSPSTISTSPDHPGTRYTFTIEVIPGECAKENLIFTDIKRPEEIECLVLSQEKETENEGLRPLMDLGIKLNYLIYRQESTESLFQLVAERLPSVHMILIINSATQDGISVADELVRKDLSENQVLILFSSIHGQEYYTICRSAGIDYYLEEPFEPYRFVEILTKHFPGLSQEDFSKIPESEKMDPNLNILLAEDNIFNRKVIQGLFKKLGFEIDFAENGLQAVEMVKEKTYDIVFMDLLMPEMDGMQAVIEIRKQGLKLPIIALTADENKYTRKAAMEAGFDDYLIKPASAERLRKILSTNRSNSV